MIRVRGHLRREVSARFFLSEEVLDRDRANQDSTTVARCRGGSAETTFVAPQVAPAAVPGRRRTGRDLVVEARGEESCPCRSAGVRVRAAWFRSARIFGRDPG